MKFAAASTLLLGFSFGFRSTALQAQAFSHAALVHFDPVTGGFPLADAGKAAPIYLDPSEEKTLGATVEAFASDVERVSGHRPQILTSLPSPRPAAMLVVGTIHAPAIAHLAEQNKLPLGALEGKWESAETTVVSEPLPGVRQALIVAGSDRRGAAFALFELSRQMGVSPWAWWADVPVQHRDHIWITAHNQLQPEPSVQYRGIFLNDEDWGLRPWAAQKMDPAQNNIGPHTYERIFELLLRLHANSLWPAMHPGTLPFNAVDENARLADRWGIVMGSSHSEALLRNNVGEWDEHRDGPWNYQVNRRAIDAYWNRRLELNGHYENFYTVGMRGVHDSGLEAKGSVEDKARLVEQAMADQRSMLAEHVNANLGKVPQVIWLYKESLALYRAGMKVPDDVTLGWTDDNYGFLRQLPTVEEQKRSGGSAVYYHVSYWGSPHDYLWLCTTPPALIREEMTKAYDHNARKYWILNVGDLKPAEADIDYFLQLAWDEPAMEHIDQHDFLRIWFAEQFPTADSDAMASVMDTYYQLNFIRKPEFMGFNGYNDGVRLTAFNPQAWGSAWGQNGERVNAWEQLVQQETKLSAQLPAAYRSAFFELVGYPVEASAAQNWKFLFTDRTYLDAKLQHESQKDAAQAQAAYQQIQQLTEIYNRMENGKWYAMMSSAPRERNVFKMPAAAQDAATPLPDDWAEDRSPQPAAAPQNTAAGFVEQHGTVSINAAHFVRHFDGRAAAWRTIPDLGISAGGSVVYGNPGALSNLPAQEKQAEQPWVEYEFTTAESGTATLELSLLPTFPVDAQHPLRFGVAMDGAPTQTLDASGSGEWKENGASTWEKNVLRDAALFTLPVTLATPGKHTVRLSWIDPGVVFEHLVLRFPGAPPAYPVPPETLAGKGL
ncbi:glycosyl hydrolase 115 family protein [Telmatobacter bradus]|uniref:glycosyl hydrolase 115 family protein n=1 Tax=Telmatobacter bradus TaxID=474953 RepID=UPI003B429A6E